MIDQNNEIIQELKNRPINENGSIHVARENNYSDLIKDKTLQMLNNKKLMKFECYVEWLENQVLYMTYSRQWKENQRKFIEERWIKTQEVDDAYIKVLEDTLALKERIIKKKEKQLKDTKEKMTTLKKEMKK